MMKYKNFEIKDIFNIDTGGDVIISNAQKGIYPLVSHQHDQNGISKYIDALPNRKLYNHKSTIALADRGVFYATTQKSDFYIGTRVKALNFIDGEKSENVRLYFVTAINKLQSLFKEYSNNATNKLPYLKINLPVNSNDEINYNYMEEYIINLKIKMVNDLKIKSNLLLNKYLKVSKLDNVKFTEKDTEILEKYETTTKKVYFMGDLFYVKSNPQLNKDSFVFNSKAKYPYFTRSVLNNGILGYVEYLDDEHLVRGNSLAVGMLGMKFFYMKHDYYAGQFTKSIVPKFENFEENIAQFFITILNKNTKVYQRVLVRNFEKEFLKTKVELPIDDNGNIDFELINMFINIQKRKVLIKIEKDNELKIEKLKNCVISK